MAINVNQVYKTVLLILNKEQRGYITPDEFNKIATQVQLETFENYSEDLNQLIRVPQTDTDYANRVANIDEKLAIFKRFGTATYDNSTTPANPFFTLPADLYRLGATTYKGLNDFTVELQRLQRNEFYDIQNSPLTASTISFPTYLYENERLYVRPTSIINNINVDYLKKPDNVRWGYSVGSLGQYVYDSTVYGDSLLNTGTGTLTSSTAAITDGVIGTYTPAYSGGSGTGLVLSANVTSATAVEMSVTTAGTGYVVGDVITISGGVITTSNPVTITLKASDFNDNSTYGSTNFELHPSEQTDVIIKILFYSGVVIRDPQIVQVAAQTAQADEVNEKR
tara:strand:- start:2323 stop:3336 length:1014 start_codon:yes stop_codon:yes gene_type:complete